MAVNVQPLVGRAGRPLSYLLDESGTLRRGLSTQELQEAVRAGRGSLWVDIDSRHEEEWSLLTDLFRFHPLAVEDTRSPNCRVKLEEYDGHIFVVARAVRFATWTPEPYDIEATNFYLFLGRNFVVTVHAEPLPPVETAAERLDAGSEVLSRGVEHLAYLLLDTLVDLYFPLLDELDTFVDELEEGVFQGSGGTMEQVFDLRRMLLVLRRHLTPMRDVVITLANRPTQYLRPETQVYFRDVYDHVLRQLDSVEAYRDLLTGALEMHLSLVSNRVNEVVKALSVIATIVLPPTLLASIYGMNFDFMPGLHSPFGFWIALLAMGAISGGFLAYVWWKGWW